MNKKNLYYFIRLIEQKKKIEGFERVAIALLLKNLKTFSKRVTFKNKKQTLAELNRIIKILNRGLAKSVVSVGKYAYKDTNDILSYGGLALEYNKKVMSKAQLGAITKSVMVANSRLETWIGNAILDKALLKDLNEIKRRGYGYKKAVNILVKKHLNSNRTKSDIETIAISYMQTMAAKAHKDVFKANAHLIEKYEWSAIMENGNAETGRGTCPRCAALDSQKRDKIEDFPSCPLHPRCRCIIRVVPKDLSEVLGIPKETRKERAAIRKETDRLLAKNGFKPTGEHWGYNRVQRKRGDKQKSLKDETGRYRSIKSKDKLGLNDNYATWFFSKGREWQNNAVGKTRAELLRSKRIKFKDLVDVEGKLILLRDLPQTD